MAITNLTGTKWTFNDTISLDLLTVGQIYYLNFKSNGKDYIGFQSAGGVSLGCVYNNGGLSVDTAWTDEQWYNEALRTIEITDGADVENADLIAFLETNATQIKEPITQLRPFLKSIADSIRSKKGTTEPINAQNFASEIESIEGGSSSGATIKSDNWSGTAVPLIKDINEEGVVIENIYLNKQLSIEEVCNLIDECNKALNDGTKVEDFSLFVFTDMNFTIAAGLGCMNGLYTLIFGSIENSDIAFVYDSTGEGQDVAELGFSGWNSEISDILEINGYNYAGLIEQIPTNLEGNELVKSLFSITPFEKINIELSGNYAAKTLTITENGTTNLINDIKDNKEIATSVKVDTYDYQKWLSGICPEEIDFTINNGLMFMFSIKYQNNLKKLIVRTKGEAFIPNESITWLPYLEHLELRPSDELFNNDGGGFLDTIYVSGCISGLFSLKTLILDYPTIASNDSFDLNTALRGSCYFNGTSGTASIITVDGFRETETINPNKERIGIIYVNDDIYDSAIADANNSNYVSQIKRLSEYVE